MGERREFRDEAGRLHRDHGPALIHASGSCKWYRHGRRGREDGPARVYVNGTRSGGDRRREQLLGRVARRRGR